MAPLRYCVVIWVIAALWLAPAAGAARPRLGLAYALEIAARTWGPAPCPDGVRVAWTDLSQFAGYADAWAAAYMPGTAPPGQDCTIFFDSYDWRTVRAWWVGKCTFIVHEYGHLTGHQHSPDPHNVMYGGDGAFYPYWRCIREQRAVSAQRKKEKRSRTDTDSVSGAG